MRADMRFLTAIALIGICGFAIARGWGIVHFSLAMANIDASQKQGEISKWTSVPDVASTALRMELRNKIDTSNPRAANRRREALSSMLSIKPLSSVDWLSLSVMQSVMSQPREALRSLKLSVLTGPNEGYLMTKRGILGASIWEILSPDLRTRIANDLAAGDLNGIEKLQGVLTAKPQRVRHEIQEAVRDTGISSRVMKILGF